MNLDRSDLKAAAWLFEQLSIEAGYAADRSRIQRTLIESAAATSSEHDDHWWSWLIEASRSLGLKFKLMDCSFREIRNMTREGGRVITHVGEPPQWVALLSSKRQRFQLLQPEQDQSRLWVSSRKLRRLLNLSNRDKVVRCLVIKPDLSSPSDGTHETHHLPPLDRVLTLMKPEASDIWTVTVFALITGLLALATPLAVESLVNTVAFGRLIQPVVILALMLLAFLSFSAALLGLKTYVVEIIQRRIFARVTADLSYRLPRVIPSSLEGQSGRELVNRFFDVITVQKASSALMLDGISLVLNTLIGMTVLAFYHPWLLGFDIVLLALILFVIFVLGRGAVNTSIKESKAKYTVAAWLEDLVGCPTAFRYRGAAEFALDQADHYTYEYLNARKKHFRIVMRQIVFSLGLQAAASTTLLGLGGWLVIAGQLTLGELVAAELIVTVIVGSFAKMGKHLQSYYDLLASVDKLGGLFDLPIERQDGLLQLSRNEPAEVSVNGVGFANFHGGTTDQQIDLYVKSGERLMLTGPSGSGKSRLLNLLFGLTPPAKGHVYINEVDPRDMRPDALRKYVTLVRNIEIFTGTLEENIHLDRSYVSTSDVREALEWVGLYEQILQLPQGLQTHLVDNGYPLTEIQARKLMLARAIVGRPRLLLIDGLLDALPDAEAETLTHMLSDPTRLWTLIMVTGRQSLMELGTNIYTLRDSEAILSGGPTDVS
ncbi:Alpha-hemolysin translocation ATP-binding protein HlyB [Gimesia chilikensis]|uniref:Alpha-hemolysin translocation ATP-binding protein HlyB n=1 Tax=Gimesia chilikensis TaxID=2605989 RepID=A0A517WJR0_9PLAN|nr:ATP-binding cassette domain-containing protein [Gimesia chilikensis]QDU05495.1 Alpha-hemolysin translocation ATP-binding protein HlyB [Gimesia chilikensis]